MNWWQIGLIAYFALNALMSVAWIGKVRKPMTPGSAAVALILYAGLIYAAVQA